MGEHLVGLKKYTIRELEPNTNHAMLVCIIINKQRAKKFVLKGDASERAVWNFTVRDSPSDYVNVVCWGGVNKIFALSEKFQVGDVVEIQKPRVEIRKVGDYGDQFHPMVTSPFKLTINENESEIILMRDGHFDNLQRVLHLPTKPIANYVTLSDIHTNVQSLEGQYVDIFVAVKYVGEVRNVNTRFGETQVRNLVVFDYTNPGLSISIWDSEYIARASMWKPRLTILFMTDMKIMFDGYLKVPKASISLRSIITEDPLCKEADNLREFAKSAPIDPSAILDEMACAVPDPRTIRTIMNIQQIQTKIDQILNTTTTRPEDLQFTALLFASITHMDLDGNIRVISTRCTKCKNLITNVTNQCENAQCIIGMGAETVQPETNFDIRLTVSDHTGSLVNCRLNGKYAEAALVCTAQDFLSMTDEQKSLLKWKYLMERCDLRIMVFCVKGRNPLISILSCDLVDLSDITNKL